MGGKSGGDSSDWYRDQEKERQATIRSGTADINAIFDGGTFGRNEVLNPVAGQTYYLANGEQYTVPMPEPTAATGAAQDPRTSSGLGGFLQQGGLGGLFGAAKTEQAPTRDPMQTGLGALLNLGGKQKESSTPTLYSSVETVGGFDDAFYDRQRQAYLDYAMPQLEDQRAKAARELTYSLARSGQLGGSVRASQEGELTKAFDLQSQNIADQALNYENEARTNVENARSDLLSMLSATGDAKGAVTSALARSQALSQPATYSPLTDLFSEFTGALGTASAAERARAYGWGAPSSGAPSGVISYGTPSGAVTVR